MLDLLREVWASPMLRDMPHETEMTQMFSLDRDELVVRITTRDCQTTYAPAFASLKFAGDPVREMDRGLADLRRQHWYHMGIRHGLAGYAGWV